MKYLSFFLFSFLLFSFSSTVQAQDASSYVKQCGAPEDYDLEIYGDFSVCDVYQRQLQYKYKADKFRRQLNKRNALFAAPRKVMLDQYYADLEHMQYGDEGRIEMVGDAVDTYPHDAVNQPRRATPSIGQAAAQ